MSAESLRNVETPLKIQLEGDLLDLKDSKSAERYSKMTRLHVAYAEKPEKLFSAINLLETDEDLANSTYAEKLRENFRSEKIYKKMCDSNYLQEVLLQLNGENEDIARDFLFGFLSHPSDYYKVGQKNSLEGAHRRAVKVNYVFAEAITGLMENLEESTVVKSLGTYKQVVFSENKNGESDIMSMCALATRSDDDDIFEKADISLGTISEIEKIISRVTTIDEIALNREEEDYVKDLDKELGELVDVYGIENIVDRGEIFITMLARIEGVVDEAIFNRSSFNVDGVCAKGDISSVKQPNELADRVVNLALFESARVLEENGYDIDFISTPGGITSLIFLESEKYSQEEKDEFIREGLAWRLGEELQQHIYDPGMERIMVPEEMETMIRYLAPDEKEKKLKEKNEELSKKVRSGWYALSSRGNVVMFDLDEEEWIREMGISKMVFKQKDESVQVNLTWRKHRFDFSFDGTFTPRGLDGMSKKEKDWLLTFTYGYLAAIKNPDKALSVQTVEDQDRVESTAESGERKTRGRRAHLRMQRVGYEARHSESDAKRASSSFGIEIEKLNDYFLKLQDRMQSVDKLLENEPENTREVYKMFLITALKRIIPREEKPRWHTKGEKGPEVKLENPIVGMEKPRYSIRYIRETEVDLKKDKPIQIQCPGVADEILNL